MNKKKTRELRKKLEKLIEEGRKLFQKELDNCPVQDDIIFNTLKEGYKVFVAGVNKTCEIIYEKFGINHEQFKIKNIEENKSGGKY